MAFRPVAVFPPPFVREARVRRYIQAIYVALVQAVRNAELLTCPDPSLITPDLAAGNPLTRRCLHDAVLWLRRMKEFTVSEDVYQEQVVEPVRLAARFRLQQRDTSSATGLVVSISPEFYDRYFSSNVRDLCLVVPRLAGALTLRCRPEHAKGLRAGMTVEVSGVQPLPYVNRLHPVAISITPSQDGPPLSQLKFLSASLSDVELIPGSLAFENFCGVMCLQRKRPLLGQLLLLSGRIFRDTPWFYLWDLTGTRRIDLIGHEAALASSVPDGSLAFVLAVVWYRKKLSPEALLVEVADDEEDVTVNELTGFVRVRQSVDLNEAKKRFPGAKFSDAGCVVQEDGDLVWRPPEDPAPCDRGAFLTLRMELLRIRNKKITAVGRGPFVRWHSILDRNKLTLEALANRVAKDDEFKNCLLQVMRLEEVGRHPSSLMELGRPSTTRWLIDTGLISRTGRKGGHVYSLTQCGKEAVFHAIRQHVLSRLRWTFSQRGLVILPDEAGESGIPHRVLLRGLKELRGEGAVPLGIDGDEIKSIWVRSGDPAVQEEGRRHLHYILDSILSVLKGFPHALHELKILEITGNLNLPALREALRLLKKREKVQEIDDGVWIYPYEQRLLDVMAGRPDTFYTIGELMSAAGIPPIRQPEVLEILQDLQEKERIVKVTPHHWAIHTSEQEVLRRRQENLLIWECGEALLRELPASGCQEEWAAGILKITASKLIRERYSEAKVTPGNVARRALSQLLEGGRLTRRAGFLYPARRE